MKTFDEIIEIGKSTVSKEVEAVSGIRDNIGPSFAECIELLLHCKGRVVVTGIGKSAHVAGKIVATLNSTGTPAIFMHAADAIHGDLGIVQRDDVVLCLSKSGNTPEIKALVPLVRSRGYKLIAMVGNSASYLAGQADIVLDVSVAEEACPNNLAPTSSTTAQIVMGDAVAMSLLECRGFSSKDFADVHPGGALGKKLYMRVSDLYQSNPKPEVGPDASIKEAIVEISSKRLGMTAVTRGGKLLGIITDGDLRRMLEKDADMEGMKASDIMTPGPKTTAADELAVRALATMEQSSITQLVVLKDGAYDGVIHLHDLLKEGII